MANLKINFLKACSERSRAIKERVKKRRVLGWFIKFMVYFLVVLGLAILVFSEQIIFSNESLMDYRGFGFIYSLIGKSNKPLLGEENNRINILLLGQGGVKHEGPFLTDTIILASFEPKTKRVAFLSIPRDLVVPIPGYGWRKINSANAFGEVQKPGSGPDLAKEIISKTLDISIPYYIRVDFDAFQKAVDDVGGIKIYVENSFTDPLYPGENFEYKTISFEKGWQIMDGARALEFVRSRHGGNGEGSDFGRSRRQQQVLLALKEKATSLNFLINPKNISNILENVGEHVKTNLGVWEIIRLAKLGKDIDQSKVTNQVLEASAEGPLKEITSGGAYVLTPKAGNFTELQEIARNIFNLGQKEKTKEESKKEEARIEIQNGTSGEGLAYNTSMMLRAMGYEVVKISNAKTQDYEKTVIYDLSQGKKPNTLEILKEKFDTNVSPDIPAWLSSSSGATEVRLPNDSQKKSEPADFLIILGKNSAKTIY